jgi:hypothetical protein
MCLGLYARARRAAMITIPGGIVRGLGAGAKTVKLQMPHFLKDCQELEICHCATINAILECQLEVTDPDLIIGPVVWWPQHPRVSCLAYSRFDLTSMNVPYGSPHQSKPYHVEILALQLSLSHPSTCTIHLSARAFRELAVPICRTEQSGYQPRQRFLVDD